MRGGMMQAPHTTPSVFRDRSDAGRKLAELLVRYSGPNTVVYAIPNGGVVVGFEVAQMLHAPLGLAVIGTIAHPISPSFAVCAVTEHGDRVCDEFGMYALDEKWVEHQTEITRRTISDRCAFFGVSDDNDLSGKTVIIVDDGMVTGLPMKAAITLLRQRNPKQLIAAAPSAPIEIVEKIAKLVDDVEVLTPDKQYRGVTRAYYEHFPTVTDAEVTEMLHRHALLHGAGVHTMRPQK